MRKIVLLAASMVATLAMCVGVSAADSVPSDVNLNNFKLSWSDEFDGTSLNDAYWTPQIGNGIEYGNRGETMKKNTTRQKMFLSLMEL